jgi:hypothetical protein
MISQGRFFAIIGLRGFPRAPLSEGPTRDPKVPLSFPKGAPRAFQRAQEDLPTAPQVTQGPTEGNQAPPGIPQAPQGTPKCPSRTPRAPKSLPKSSQHHQRRPPRAPKSFQKVHKMTKNSSSHTFHDKGQCKTAWRNARERLTKPKREP